MNVYDIVESEITEYVKGGSGAGSRISPERMAELDLNVTGNWHIYGTDTSTWEYSPAALKELWQEGMEQHIRHTFDIDPNSEKGKELAVKIMTWLNTTTGGQTSKQNIINAFKFVSEQDGENGTDPIKHNEALGLMMNMLLLINDAIERVVNDQD